MNQRLTLAKALKLTKLEHSQLAYIILTLRGDDRLIAMLLIGSGLDLDGIMNIRIENMSDDDFTIRFPNLSYEYLLPQSCVDEILKVVEDRHGVKEYYVSRLHRTYFAYSERKDDSPYLFGVERESVKNTFLRNLNALSNRHEELKGLNSEMLRLSFFKFYHIYGKDVISLSGLEKISGYSKKPASERQKYTPMNKLYSAMINIRYVHEDDDVVYYGNDRFLESPTDHVYGYFIEDIMMSDYYFIDDHSYREDLLSGVSMEPEKVGLVPYDSDES